MRLHLHRLIALCLVLLWGPATMCCALEAAGIESVCADGNCHSADGAKASADACNLLESGDYQGVNSTIKASVPVSFVCDWLIWLKSVMDLSPAEGLAVASADERPRDWTVRWHFERRAAALAHAPDSQLG